MDVIRLSRMQFYGRHGVFPEERRLGQRIVVSLALKLDLAEAGRTDDLAQTVDYAEVYRLVQGAVEGERHRLLEALAERIATRILDAYDTIQEVTVTVAKPHPPFPAVFDGVEVELTRSRSGRHA